MGRSAFLTAIAVLSLFLAAVQLAAPIGTARDDSPVGPPAHADAVSNTTTTHGGVA